MINSWNEFDPLKKVVVGSVYDESFFDDIKNTKIKDGLQRICKETEEDINNFIDVMEGHDVDCIQILPQDLGYKNSILDYMQDGIIGKDDTLTRYGYGNGLPEPPLAVRDDCIVMGNKILVTDGNNEMTKPALPIYESIFGEDSVDNTITENKIMFKRSVKNIESWAKKNNLELDEEDIESLREEKKLNGWCSPNLTRIGKKVLVDVWQTPHVVEEFLEPHFPDLEFKKIFIGGHNDSVFTVLRPGLVVATHYLKPYADIFHGWDIIWLEETDWSRECHNQQTAKSNNRGCYWYPEKEKNEELENFIDTFLENWTGDASESVFDVNVLMLDHNKCVVNSFDSKLISELEKRNIEPIHIPLRNRFFWDGGWHCNTLDVVRDGVLEDYGI